MRNGTRPDQHTVRATLATVADAGVQAPSAIVVGDVAALDLSWFEARPLFGRSVVVTRAREQASELRTRLEDLGAEVIELPAIAITPIDFTVPALDAYEWLVFTSVNGVRAFFDRGLAPAGLDARALGGVRVAAIGPGTAHELATRGIVVDLVPERFVAEALLDAFPRPPRPGHGCCSPGPSRHATCCPTASPSAGTRSTCCRCTARCGRRPTSESSPGSGPATSTRSRSRRRRRSRTSAPSSIHSPTRNHSSCRSGPSPRKTAAERGLRVDAEAADHTIDGLVSTLLAAFGVTGVP